MGMQQKVIPGGAGGFSNTATPGYESDKTQSDIFWSGFATPWFWSTEQAQAWSEHHGNVMKNSGNLFGYNLHTAWLSGKESYTPSDQDIRQVANDSYEEVGRHLLEYLDGTPGCPDWVFVNSIKKDTDFGRDNWNMFFAYGGARLSMRGSCKLKKHIEEGGFCSFQYEECKYTCDLTVTWDDTYTFKPGANDSWADSIVATVSGGSVRNFNPYYDAAAFLQVNMNGTPVANPKGVTHTLSYDTTYEWTHYP